jgi:cellobiose phosphorylase
MLSGAADPTRARTAMDAVDERLVRRGDGLVCLLDPPFDTSDLAPGYIKGYVPGVRENGGQYTHAAIWVEVWVRAVA